MSKEVQEVHEEDVAGGEKSPVQQVEKSMASLSIDKPLPVVSDSAKHPLHNRWVIWYDNPKKRQANESWEECLKEIYTFDTVEDFWCVFNNILSPSKLCQGSNYHIFKKGIRPMWEDPINEKGGKWILTIPKSKRGKLDDFWTNSILSIIGENLSDNDDVCGAVVSVRKSQDRIAIWTKTASNETLQRTIGTAFRAGLDLSRSMILKYQSHADAAASGSSFQNQVVYEV